jgi:hypothetical protein
MKTRLLIARMREKGMKWSEISRLTKIDVTRIQAIHDGADPTPKEVEIIAGIGV